MARRRVMLGLALMLGGCSRQPPPDPRVTQALQDFDTARTTYISALQKSRDEHPGFGSDFRGRTLAQDLDQWAIKPMSANEAESARDRIQASRYPADAEQALKAALSLLKNDAQRANEISKYWYGHLPAPYWRGYWKSLYEANGIAPEPPDSMLASIETRMKGSLDQGNFAAAGEQAEELISVFAESKNRAAERIRMQIKSAPVFQPRKSACLASTTRPQGDERPKIVRGESVESFYPSGALARGEDGTIVLRAQIDSHGCAKSVAIIVHSGVPALDGAALSWFESATFSPASRGGLAIESELTWKIRFALRQG